MESPTARMPVRRWLGEFVVIVLGVFVALVADRWQSSLDDRERETKFLARIRSEIAEDTVRLANLINRADQKLAALARIESILSRQPSQSTPELASSLLAAERPLDQDFRSTAYDELQSTGQLNLIRDDETRETVMRYYENIERFVPRIEMRRSPFPALVTSHLPPSVRSDSLETQVDLTADWPARVTNDPAFSKAANLEYDYAWFARLRFGVIRRSGVAAIVQINRVSPGQRQGDQKLK
jgi:hypothetical protein